MKVSRCVPAAVVGGVAASLPSVVATQDGPWFSRLRQVEAHLEQQAHAVQTASTSSVFTEVVCATPEAATYFGYKCKTSPTTIATPNATTATPTTAPKPVATVSTTATYALHALAIGDWGVDLGLGSCCNKYRQTGKNNPEYYKDQQAQPNVAYLLALSAAQLKPKVILGHGYVHHSGDIFVFLTLRGVI
jgi:hypothetical protein